MKLFTQIYYFIIMIIVSVCKELQFLIITNREWEPALRSLKNLYQEHLQSPDKSKNNAKLKSKQNQKN